MIIVDKKSLIGGEVMDEHNLDDKNKFLYPRSRYYGQVKPENLVFNANLQEFAQKVGYITGLETSGKLDPEDAYKQIKALWQQLKRSKKALFIGEEPQEKS
ncbi:Isopropylmalate/homocitrate/citramalate synthases [Nostoc flagelliforme CCNUN1]|uniref:Isopropylmalate/homocitrate/citramalate synthases n=2 Tax=Nostoc flagelliforme TaxID=1306274 RepID=A0A2K8T0D5_9NOSO|nr:Isopropylmalate/homocitrate/citramalate synthases [Nostoc flagelliforme CCNUN1]